MLCDAEPVKHICLLLTSWFFLEGRVCLGIRREWRIKQGAVDYLLILKSLTVLLKGTSCLSLQYSSVLLCVCVHEGVCACVCMWVCACVSAGE